MRTVAAGVAPAAAGADTPAGACTKEELRAIADALVPLALGAISAPGAEAAGAAAAIVAVPNAIEPAELVAKLGALRR